MLRTGVIAILVVAAACRDTTTRDPATDAGLKPDAPPPRGDLVQPVGSAATLEIATWNIENFPDTASTPGLVADLITSLDLDVVVVEEIASETAWAELLARLPEHDGVLSTHRYTPTDYQKLGVIYRASLVTVGAPTLLFVDDTFAFPRPPFALPITVDGNTLELIGVHLKAGVTTSDADRRRAAVIKLDAFLRAQLDGGGEDEVILLGDYNQEVTSDEGRDVLGPLLGAPERYAIRTEPSAAAGGITYLGFGGKFIDHVTTTTAVGTRWPTARVEIPRIDQQIVGYTQQVSDHLPVVLIAPR